jgi:hypothetical protein
MADFGYCRDCKEINYALRTKNGVMERGNVANNHHNCKGWIDFDKSPKEYPSPIANVLTKLNAKMDISHNEIVLFKMAIELDDNFAPIEKKKPVKGLFDEID